MYSVAFVLGVLGSFHCVGMCAPIALMLPFGGRSGRGKKMLRISLYFLGKTISYLSLGVIFFLMGKGLFIAEYQQVFSIMIGVGMLCVVVFGKWFNRRLYSYSLSPWVRFVNQIKIQMAREFRQNRSASAFFIGFFNGFLPCGLVYMALFAALTQISLQNVLIYILCFSLGTIPLMATTIIIGNFIGVSLRNTIQKCLPFFVIIIAILFIVRGLGLSIPYMSPSTMSLRLQSEAECVVPGTN